MKGQETNYILPVIIPFKIFDLVAIASKAQLLADNLTWIKTILFSTFCTNHMANAEFG